MSRESRTHYLAVAAELAAIAARLKEIHEEERQGEMRFTTGSLPIYRLYSASEMVAKSAMQIREAAT